MEKNYNRFTAITLSIVGLLLFYISGFRPIGIDNDSQVYALAVYYIDFDIRIISEPAFVFFAEMANYVSIYPVRILFMVFSAIAITLKMYSIGRYSANPFFSLLIYICLYFVLHDFTQIRAGVSAAFFLFAYNDAVSGRRVKYLVKILMACLFHYSSILFLPILFFSRKKINISLYLLTPFIFMFLMFIPNLIGSLSSLFSLFPDELSTRAITYINQIQNVDSGFGLLQTCMFILFVLYGISLLKMKRGKVNAFDIISFKYLSLTFSLYFLFSPVPIIAVRSFELMAVSLIYILPVIVSKLVPKTFICYVAACCLIGYFLLVSLRIVNFSMIGQY